MEVVVGPAPGTAPSLPVTQSWRALFQGSPVGIGLSDEHGRFVAANDALCSLLGRSEAALIGRSSRPFTHPDDRAAHAQAGRQIRNGPGGVAQIEKRYLRPDGEVRWVWLSATHTPGPDGQVWTLAYLHDITERKRVEQAVADHQDDLRQVAAVVGDIQNGADARQAIVDAAQQLGGAHDVSLAELVTPDALQITRSSDERLIGTRVQLSATSATVHVFRSRAAMFLADPADNPLVAPIFLALKDTRSAYILPLLAGDEAIAVLLVAWRDRVPSLDDRRAAAVTALAANLGATLRQASRLGELESLALTDALTGLPNRRHWDQRLALLMALAGRNATPLTVALADLDLFKHFNDAHGHPAGDMLLRDFGVAAQEVLRVGDAVARWGGEEFVFALPDCPAAEAATVLDRIRAAVPCGQTCSIGFATWNGLEDAASLLARVDHAMYAAKDAGRDQARLAVSN